MTDTSIFPAVFRLTTSNTNKSGKVTNPAKVATGARAVVLARLATSPGGRLRTTKAEDFLTGVPVTLSAPSVWAAVQSLRDNGAITESGTRRPGRYDRRPKAYAITRLGRAYIGVSELNEAKLLMRDIRKAAAKGADRGEPLLPVPTPVVPTGTVAPLSFDGPPARLDVASAMRRCTEWHLARFPDAEAIHVAMKLATEAGELGDVINGLAGQASPRYRVEDQLAEAADVLITLFILLGRYTGADEEEVAIAFEAKLAKLITPGAHRASLAVSS